MIEVGEGKLRCLTLYHHQGGMGFGFMPYDGRIAFFSFTTINGFFSIQMISLFSSGNSINADFNPISFRMLNWLVPVANGWWCDGGCVVCGRGDSENQ